MAVRAPGINQNAGQKRNSNSAQRGAGERFRRLGCRLGRLGTVATGGPRPFQRWRGPGAAPRPPEATLTLGRRCLVPLTNPSLPLDVLPRRFLGKRRPILCFRLGDKALLRQCLDLGGPGLACRLGRSSWRSQLGSLERHRRSLTPKPPQPLKRARVASGDRPEPTEAAAETAKLLSRLSVLLGESSCLAPLDGDLTD